MMVIPHVGMWIEIPRSLADTMSRNVIPHVGMWIEMFSVSLLFAGIGCHPSRRDVD